MEKEFIPYEQALDLKELGFEEECFAQYSDKALCQHGYGKVRQGNLLSYNCITPLYQQAFRWFREKYKLVAYIEYYAEWNFEIFRIDDKIAEVQVDVWFDYTFKGGTYEEAELECLKKLISIVKK
jgi:hypothetical protein